MNRMKQHVASAVRAESARRRVSQGDIATALDLSRTSVNRRLSGEVAFDVEELGKVADLLDVPLAALLPSDKASA